MTKKNLEENQEAKTKKTQLPLEINRGVELMLRGKKEVNVLEKSDTVFIKSFSIFGKYFKFTFECY